MRNRLDVLAAIIVGLSIGCVTDRVAANSSPKHAAAIKSVTIGQSMNQVYRAAGSPETRTMRQGADKSVVERWGYVTDYANDVLTTVVFTNRIVTGIENEKWDGLHLANAVPLSENLDTPDEASTKVSNLAHFDSVIKPGMMMSDVFPLTGKLSDSMTAVIENNVVKQTTIYNMSDGTKITIWSEDHKIVKVSRQ